MAGETLGTVRALPRFVTRAIELTRPLLGLGLRVLGPAASAKATPAARVVSSPALPPPCPPEVAASRNPRAIHGSSAGPSSKTGIIGIRVAAPASDRTHDRPQHHDARFRRVDRDEYALFRRALWASDATNVGEDHHLHVFEPGQDFSVEGLVQCSGYVFFSLDNGKTGAVHSSLGLKDSVADEVRALGPGRRVALAIGRHGGRTGDAAFLARLGIPLERFVLGAEAFGNDLWFRASDQTLRVRFGAHGAGGSDHYWIAELKAPTGAAHRPSTTDRPPSELRSAAPLDITEE